MPLGEFLLQAARDAGPWNCSTMPADWCVSLGHPDFAAAWRNVTAHADCERVQADAGGLLRLWNEGIANRLPVVADLRAGDIAVLAAHGMEAGGICTGDKWALRSPRGLTLTRWPAGGIIKAWRP